MIQQFKVSLLNAFPVHPVCKGDSFIPFDGDSDRKRYNALFRGVEWSHVTYAMTKEIKDDYVAFSAEGLGYYLPALFVSSLEDFLGQDVLPENLLWYFEKGARNNPSPLLSDVLGRMNKEQIELCAQFFELIEKNYRDYLFERQMMQINRVSVWLRTCFG